MNPSGSAGDSFIGSLGDEIFDYPQLFEVDLTVPAESLHPLATGKILTPL
jgi:hypothetical protein